MALSRTVVDIPATPHFDFIYGRYELSSWHIPYLSTTMTLVEAAESLRLAAEFPGSEQINWKLDELYQRDVNWPRVEQKILPYLRSENQPHFFNALTIALIPFADLSETLDSFHEDVDWAPPGLDSSERFGKVVDIGPISLGYWEDWSSIYDQQAVSGQLRWNPKQVFAVALDGQHRLAAIKEFSSPQSGSQAEAEKSQVPVILLILDPALGYAAPTGRPLVEVLRRIFIDLNKHAQTVSRGRQILLDDKDPTSVCVRALVGESLVDGLEELDQDPPRLPLSFVDWHSDQAKFDEGPYLATTLGLDWAVANMLGTKPISDCTDYGAINRQLRAIQNSLGLDLSVAKSRLTELSQIKLRPFYYDESPGNDELSQIGGAFQQVWNPAFCKLLTAYMPYKELVDLRASQGSFSLTFSNWFYELQKSKADKGGGRASRDYRALLSRLASRPDRPIGVGQLEELLGDIEGVKERNLAFNVVFQRAYFLAFAEFTKIQESDLTELEDEYLEEEIEELDDEDFELDDDELDEADGEEPDEEVAGDEIERRASHVAKRSDQYVRYLNSVYESIPEMLRIDCSYEVEGAPEGHFWLGSMRKAEGDIDFTQGASKRASELLFWVCAMQAYDEVLDPNEESEFDEFWENVLAGNTNLTRRVWRSIKRFSEKESSGGGKILASKDEEFSVEASRNEARVRMQWIWEQLGL